jgi:hypothetical protein
MTDFIQSISPGPKWTYLRTITAAAGPTFNDETNWAGGGTVPPVGECISVGNLKNNQVEDLGTVLLYAVLTTASAAAIVARGAFAFEVQALEVVARPQQRSVPNAVVVPDHAIDSLSVASCTAQRKIGFNGRGIDRMAFRLHTFSGTPGTAAQLHLFYRLE